MPSCLRVLMLMRLRVRVRTSTRSSAGRYTEIGQTRTHKTLHQRPNERARRRCYHDMALQGGEDDAEERADSFSGVRGKAKVVDEVGRERLDRSAPYKYRWQVEEACVGVRFRV